MGITRVPKDFERGNSLGRLREQSIYVGIVKKTDDAQRMGRIAVYIPELSSVPDDEGQWIVVSYASPFAGASDPTRIQAGSQTEEGSQTSYGFWMVPPDLNNEVLVCFANGDIGRGFWFGCLFQQNMNHMVPGIACNIPTDPSLKDGSGTLPPVVEYNKSNASSVENPQRAVFSALYNGLKSQGLTKDFERGPASTSARREAPSKVFGYSTPRGNCMHIDDNEENELIRLRTRSGAQILINETSGYIYINSKAGKSWVEISDSGVNIYSLNAVSVRSENDINFRADGNIALDAGGSIALRASQGLYLGAGQTINMGAGLNLVASAGGALALTATGDLTIKADANLRAAAGADISLKAGGNSFRDGALIADNAGKSPDVADNLANLPAGGKVADNIAGRGTLTNTIASVMPTHEPWIGHPKSDRPDPQGEGGTSGGSYGGAGVGSGGEPTTSVPTGEGPRPTATNAPQQCGMFGGKSVRMSDAAHNAFKEAAGKNGLPLDGVMGIAQHENGQFDPSDKLGQATGAHGMMQIEPGTWNGLVKKYGAADGVGYGDINDTRGNIMMGTRYLAESKASFVQAGVTNPTYGQIYSGYFLGVGNKGSGRFGAALANNPNALARDVFPNYDKPGNRAVFYDAQGNPRTIKGMSEYFDSDINSKAQKFAKEEGLPGPCTAAGMGTTTMAAAGTPASAAAILAKARAAVAAGQPVGTDGDRGECAQLVEGVAPVGRAPTWTQGASVSGNSALAPGTPIAAFNPATGTYPNSHAAIYLGQNNEGLQVIDQWAGQVPHVRTIYFSHTGGSVSDNGNVYSVINSPSLTKAAAASPPAITQA